MAMNDITVTLKLKGDYAKKIRLESADRQMAMSAVVADHVYADLDRVDDQGMDAFAKLERRLVSTVLAGQSETARLRDDVGVLTAIVDGLVQQIFALLPAPVANLEAVKAQAGERYGRFLDSVKEHGFVDGRPAILDSLVEPEEEID